MPEGKMNHKFLFEEKEWKLKGTYTDDKGRRTNVTGKTTVLHKFGKWEVDAEMYVPLKGGKTLDLRNIFNIKPFKKNGFETTWTSDNKIIGKYTGRFFIAGNIIFSTYSARNGEYVGHETMEYIGGSKYAGYGKLFHNGDMESSWKVTLS